MKLFKEKAWQGWLLAGILLFAGGLKAALVLLDRIPFNSDEAVVALMARHILNGERPVFFYGQAYMGSLDAWLVALGFYLFGQQVWVIRLVQTLLYLSVIITTVWIGHRFFRSAKIGLGAGLLLAAPTVNVTLYTTASLGGYGEALLIGNLILICGLTLAEGFPPGDNPIRITGWWLSLGVLAGLGLWANGLTLIYSIPTALLVIIQIIKQRRLSENLGRVLIALGGFFIGSIAWWLFALDHGLDSLIQELFGSAVAVETGGWLVRTGNHLASLLLLGSTVTLGLRPPWSTVWLALPLIPIALFVWAVVFVRWGRELSRQKYPSNLVSWLLLAVCLTLVAGFVFTPFGVDPSGRYFVPLAVPLSLAASAALLRLKNRLRLWGKAGIAFLIVFHQWGTIQAAIYYPPGITTQFYAPAQIDHRKMPELIEFLKSEGITRGFTNYWVAYPLAFHSQEEIIFIPRLPYHADLRYTSRDDRYPPYRALVAASSQVAYITTNNPALDEAIVKGFMNTGVEWKEKWIGDYHVFYDLSRPIRPDELGIRGMEY